MFFVAAKYLDSLEKIEKIVMFFAAGSLFIGAYAVCSSISAAHAGNAAGFRAASFSGTPMHLGGMLTMSVVFLFTVIAGRIKKGKIKGYFTLFAFFALILSVAGLMLTYTRSAWLASAVGIVIAAFFTDKKLFAAVLIVFALSVFALKDTSVGKRVADAVSNTTTNTAVERILMWKSGLKIIRDNPVHGIGTANVGLVYPKYRDKKAFEPNQGHLHNNIIQVAAIDGIPGAAAILWMFVLSFFVQYRLFIKLKGDEKQYILSILAVNVSFFINGLFEYNLFSSQVVLMYWFFMGISAALYGKKEQKTVQA